MLDLSTNTQYNWYHQITADIQQLSQAMDLNVIRNPGSDYFTGITDSEHVNSSQPYIIQHARIVEVIELAGWLAVMILARVRSEWTWPRTGLLWLWWRRTGPLMSNDAAVSMTVMWSVVQANTSRSYTRETRELRGLRVQSDGYEHRVRQYNAQVHTLLALLVHIVYCEHGASKHGWCCEMKLVHIESMIQGGLLMRKWPPDFAVCCKPISLQTQTDSIYFYLAKHFCLHCGLPRI